MSKYWVTAVFVAVLVGCATAQPSNTPSRIDASSPEAAEASYKTMMKGRSGADQQKLALAVLMLNMEGVKSAHEVVQRPELQEPSISRIRDKVAGMTAEQIIERAAKNPSVRIEAAGQ